MEIDYYENESVRASFFRGWKKAINEVPKFYPDLKIDAIRETEEPDKKGGNGTLLMHEIEFIDHSIIKVRLKKNDPNGPDLLDKAAMLLLLDVPKKNYPFVVVEYQISKPDIKWARKHLKEFKKIMNPILESKKTDTKPDPLDVILWSKMLVNKYTETIPAKVGISDSGALTIFISNPLFLFWNNYIQTNDNLKDYMAVWIRSIAKVIPAVQKKANEWAYK